MRQKIIKKSRIYSQLKNIVIDFILTLNAKSSFTNVFNSFFDHFINDDIKKARTFKNMLQFLYEHYFSRLKWTRFTFNSKKCKFFISRIQILKHQRNVFDIRSSENKLKAFRKWLNSQSKTELNRFLYMLSFFKNYILDWADKLTLLKTTMIEKVITSICAKKKKIRRKIMNFI